ncbi:uncharacterized protein LOC117961135 isoform X3 [Etheostoma cragini]|uniref:uncharacterized protein LOC117961135 isoform X3 n=1 Tax=Etheostoma cragini TaxID=417921 RepID=UPI00155EA5F0|nr:uncharacterized protein LOC117961135 isoform X3 [Etheostoma cragini]
MEQEKMGTEKNMWKLRANRVKQILSSLEFGSFKKSKRFGLEFDVGFGPKQNFNVDSLPNSVLLEVAKFALALNSSQQNFIMEILEYNFDISLQSGDERNSFTCEIMNRVRQLKNSEDAVKFSKDIFELPDPMSSIKMANTRVGSVKPEVGYNISRGEECDVAPGPPAHSHAETKDHISRNSVDVYPICKEIGLKLHVNKRQPSKRLDISTLTNGAMTEVTNFAEKLCGTSEQICLDILRHNLDLDLQSGDSDLAGSIVARIPAIVEQRNLVASLKLLKKRKGTRKDSSEKVELDCQSQHKVDACSAGSSQATDPHVGNSPDTENQNALNLKLWKLRTNQIKQILSIPHEKHCPLYSYSRCQKLGLDFNVGSGVKQNLDPKLLTNGIMVELNTFATALLSAQKHFITEILEYNFHLDFKNELHRSAFAQQTLEKVKVDADKRTSVPQMKMRFELPDLRYPQDTAYEKPTYCPKCVQDQNQELDQDESDPCDQVPIQPHTITDAVTADANCTAQKPSKDLSSNFSAIEETIMDSYPRCKEIGLSLCVNKDQPRKKLDTHVLTRGAMIDVASFAKKLCATNSGIIHAVLEHNFNLGMQIRDVDIAQLFRKATALKDDELAWFDKVLVIQPSSRKQPGRVSKLKRAAAMQKSEWKDTIKKRKLSPQTKMKRATLKSHKVNDVKSNSNRQSKGSRFPICSEMTLDVEVSSKPGKRKILDMKLLTRGVCDMEQEEMETGNNYSCPLGEFDVDSNNVTHSGNADNQDHLQNPKICPMSSDISRESKSSCPGICAPILTTVDISSPLSTVNSNVNPPFASQPDESTLCGDEEQTQTPRKLSNECNIQQEKMGTENNFNFPLGESDQGADTGNEFDMEQEEMEAENDYTCPLGESDLDSDDVTDSGNTENQDHLQNPKIQSQIPSNRFPVCTEIGLDLDLSSKSEEKEKLDLKLLTRAAVCEIHKFATKKSGHYLPHTVYDILDYNFDLSSQNHRRWEFSIATSSKVKAMVRQRSKNRQRPNEVFKLPFVFASKASQFIFKKGLIKKRNKSSREEPYKKKTEGRFVRQVKYHSGVSRIHFLDGVKTICEASQDLLDPGSGHQMNRSLLSVGSGSALQRDQQIKEEYNPHYDYVKLEVDTEEKYGPHYDDFKTESNAEDVERLFPGEPSAPLEYTLLTLWPYTESQKTLSDNENVSHVKTEWDTEGVKYLVPLEAVGSQENSMVTIVQGNESTLIAAPQPSENWGLEECLPNDLNYSFHKRQV